ncbi:MAG: phosphotransferase [Ignavibacteriaceae bacterium]
MGKINSEDKLNSKLIVFFVDDVSSTKEAIENFLYGMNPNVTPKTPNTKDIKNWITSSEFLKGDEFDGYHFAFVDVELDPDFIDDKRKYAGGSDVLPFIRKNAPWLPVIGYSKHYEISDSHKPQEFNSLIHAIAGTFPFDISIPRSVLSSKKTNKTDIISLLEAAKNNRISSCIGIEPDLSNKPTLQISAALKTELMEIDLDIESLLQTFFWFANVVSLEKFTSGFSGSIVLKAYTDNKDGHLSEESMWVLKINKSSYKLHQELRSHQLMSRKGFPHAMMVPLLWPNVISNGNCGIIGYQLAKNYLPLSQSVNSKEKLFNSLNPYSAQFKDFYYRNSMDRKLLRILLQNSFGKITLSDIDNFDSLQDKFKDFINHYVNEAEDEYLDKTYEFSNCLIHGDLHCNNIMISGKNLIFIDFAHAENGAIVYDMSKLFLDIIVQLEEAKKEEFEGFGKGVIFKEISDFLIEIFDAKSMLENLDNYFLLNIFIIFHTIEYLGFKKNDPSINNWLRAYLQKISSLESI